MSKLISLEVDDVMLPLVAIAFIAAAFMLAWALDRLEKDWRGRR